MNEQEFLNRVHMRINVLQHERDLLEMVQEKQKRQLQKKVRICCVLLSGVLALILCSVIFTIDMGFIMLTSVALLVFSVWAEAKDFEAKEMEMGVK